MEPTSAGVRSLSVPTRAMPVVPEPTDWQYTKQLLESPGYKQFAEPMGLTTSYTPTLTTGGPAINYNAAQLVSSKS